MSEVSRFLEEVKGLDSRRADEDSRGLEEKILQEKKERQARRAERARSISPQKSSPANTPPPSTQRPRTNTRGSSDRLNLDSSPVLDPPAADPQSPPTASEPMAAPGLASTSPSKENHSPFDADSGRKSGAQTSPTRSDSVARGLSWQRRPNSQASDRSRSRPLSMVAAENAAARSTTSPTEPASASASESMSRDQIAAALAGKDPTWFRQTADRGAVSAAYRKNQVEDDHRSDMSAMRAQLPGMSRVTSPDSAGAGTSTPRAKLASPPALDPPAATPQTNDETSSEHRGLMSPPSGRTSPSRSERPSSPTKGMGGFVQSAMMKRSDSVNKRWSVKSPPALQRADSAVSNRNSQAGPLQGDLGSRSRPTSMMRDISSESLPHNGAPGDDSDLISARIDNALKIDTEPSEPQTRPVEKTSPPASPSKTMDPRRWSPTKSSWLESALNKPESPKPKPSPATSNQPAWMAELQKAKAQKAANPDSERKRSPTIGHKHQVSIGGLMRSTAPGNASKPPTSADIHGAASQPNSSDRPGYSSVRSSARTSPNTLQSAASIFEDQPKPAATEKHSPKESSPTGFETSAEVKPKPQVPAKMDFRAGLKHRQAPSTSSTGGQDPEFKNVFGNLRRTTTQNYKAPDELKDNITRGKAALNLTGGPQKSERKDEFKDAILAKRQAFQQAKTDGRGVSRTNSSASEQPVPEGLAKRLEMQRTGPGKREPAAAGSQTSEPRPLSASTRSDYVQGSRVGSSRQSNRDEKRDSVPETEQKDASPAENAPVDDIATSKEATAVPPPSQKEPSAPGRLQGKIGGSLANRFNPALAGMLARGPPPMASGSSGGSTTNKSDDPPAAVNDNESGSGPKLTHMTKGRARGPKRNAPSAARGQSPVKQAPVTSPAKKEPLPESPAESSTKEAAADGAGSSSGEPTQRETTPPEPKIHDQVAAFATQRQSESSTKEPDEPPQAVSSRKLNLNRVSRFLDEPKPESPKTTGANEKGSAGPERALPSTPTTEPKANADRPAGARPLPSPPKRTSRPLPEPKPLSLGKKPSIDINKTLPIPAPEPAHDSRESEPRPLPPVSSPEPLKTPMRPLPIEPKRESRPLPQPAVASPLTSAPSPARSPAKQEATVSSTLKEFFGTERPARNYKVDPAELLMNRQSMEARKIQTISAQLFQFSADGKKQPVPSHRERSLFDREMYLCTHNFSDVIGRRNTEVYLWAGDEVPQSTVDDASIFVAREAKAVGGKAVHLRQGKETPEFIQALGGVIIVQRGSGNKYDSLAPHMICGRRYHGHVVFDEVDFTPSSLCSGFPYLITQTGKCYLWKGKGSGVDELSCARLIGMDYALTGELEEMDDDCEPEHFWNLFDNGLKRGSADHWRLKPNYDKYCGRLFRSDAGSKQQIVELSPFSQADLQPAGIYILDAFFEMYIVVGAEAQAQYASFHNALDFAQEYAILAAGMEDRPFVPISTVVLEGIPRDLKSVFRKWRDADSPTVMNPPGTGVGLKRGRSLRIVSLTQALQALSE